MSNGAIRYILAISLGAAVGSIVTWRVLDKKYRLIAQEEIDSVKEFYSRKKTAEETFKDVSDADIDAGFEVTSVKQYGVEEGVKKLGDTAVKLGYIQPEPEETGLVKPKERLNDPYTICPERFGEYDDYETTSLTYYSDGILTDEADDVVDDVDGLVGPDALHSFGDYEDDSVYVRDDQNKIDYEILWDERAYADTHITQTTSPSNTEG